MTYTSTLRRHRTVEAGGRSVTLSALHPAYTSGRSIFGTRVFDVDEIDRVLKDGHQSRKIGKVVQKGRLKGAPIYTLTLEERATCPRNCREWAGCYGNNMQAAERIVAGPELEAALYDEVKALASAHQGGFLVRLHVLGDFYSEQYVALWRAMLALYEPLHVFGFTAHDPQSSIGSMIWEMTADWQRFAVRFSGGGMPAKASEVVAAGEAARFIPCPAQTGATECCATCALCWQTDRSISFVRH